MIPYDICSIFTSVPLKEAIDMYLIFDKYPNLKIARQEHTFGTHFLLVVAIMIRLMELQLAPLSVLFQLTHLWVFMRKDFFYIMAYKYTFNTHNSWLIIKKSTIITLEDTKTRSIQNGGCLLELRILYNNL